MSKHIPGRVTIITAVFNAAKSLPNCIESVLSQDYSDVEHILLDGGSIDGSIEILKQYSNRVAYWKSEPDMGVYDAWNKALEVATGEWIAFLGADDRYLPGAISSYMNSIRDSKTEYISSLVRWIRSPEKSYVIGRRLEWPRFQRYMTSAHVGSMHKYTLYERFGNYDRSYRIVGDYEMLLRSRGSLCAEFIPIITAEMMTGGVSYSFAALYETRRAKIHTGGRKPIIANYEMVMAMAGFALRNGFAHLVDKSV